MQPYESMYNNNMPPSSSVFDKPPPSPFVYCGQPAFTPTSPATSTATSSTTSRPRVEDSHVDPQELLFLQDVLSVLEDCDCGEAQLDFMKDFDFPVV